MIGTSFELKTTLTTLTTDNIYWNGMDVCRVANDAAGQQFVKRSLVHKQNGQIRFELLLIA